MSRNLMTMIARLSDHLLLCSTTDYSGNLAKYKDLAKEAIKTLSYNSPQRCIIEGKDYFLYYQISDNCVFLTLTERSYPKKLAFEYLQEVSTQFMSEYGRVISSFTRPYAALSFDQSMEKLKNQYINPNANHHTLKRLTTNLVDIHGIMQQNIQDVIHRGKTLDNLEDRTNRLLLDSQSFKEQAKHVNFMTMIKAYAPFIAVGVVILFVLLWRFFW